MCRSTPTSWWRSRTRPSAWCTPRTATGTPSTTSARTRTSRSAWASSGDSRSSARSTARASTCAPATPTRCRRSRRCRSIPSRWREMMSTSTYEHPTGSGDPAGTPLDVTAIRRDFPIFETGIAYLDSANTSQRPIQVLAKMEEYFRKYNANVERAAYKLSERATAEFEAVREKVRGFINARSAREIVYTSGTTAGLNLVAYSWGRANIRRGDLIVCTVMEHHSNLVPWQLLAGEKAARLEFVDIDERGRLRRDQFDALLAQGPKLVAFTHVSNTLGTINPVKELTAAAHAAGAVVVVDGAQGAPHLGLDVQDTDVDFYAFSS